MSTYDLRTAIEHQASDRPRRQGMEAPWRRIRTSTSVAEAHDARLGNGTRSPRTSTTGDFADRASRNVHRHPSDISTGWNAGPYTQHTRPNTGGAYVRQSDGAPALLKRSIKFTPSVEGGPDAAPVTVVRSTNLEHVSDQILEKPTRVGAQLVSAKDPGRTSAFGGWR
jgi:hypothetical protein